MNWLVKLNMDMICRTAVILLTKSKKNFIHSPPPLKDTNDQSQSFFLRHISFDLCVLNWDFRNCLSSSLTAVLDLRVGHTMDVLSPFISVLCHSDWLFHVESCPCLDVVHPGCVWSPSPVCTWHCSLHYLLLQTTSLFPHGVTKVCYDSVWMLKMLK